MCSSLISQNFNIYLYNYKAETAILLLQSMKKTQIWQIFK